MSETIRCRSWAEPGTTEVMFVPDSTEHPEPGGVNWIRRRSSPVRSASSLHPSPPVELFRAVDVRDGDDDHLELHVDSPDARRPTRVAAAVLGRTHRGLPG